MTSSTQQQQVQSIEELLALEDPTTVLTDYRDNAYQWGIGLDGSEGWQSTRDPNPITSNHLWRFIPLTVLRVGGAEPSGYELDDYREDARAALEAAAPHLLTEVTTVADLDALPRFTVIRDSDGSVFERQTMWHEAGSRDLKYWTDIALPATVLQYGWGEE